MQLDEQLSAKNGIHLTLDDDAVPMVYPYLTDDATLRQRLIVNRIYVATYWPNAEKAGSFEDILRKELLPLPIDQRIYSTTITKIFEVINE
jgi:hypothetical protein